MCTYTSPISDPTSVLALHTKSLQSCLSLQSLLFAILWTAACQAPPSMGFSRQGSWWGLPCSPPGDLPDPGTESMSLTSPALAGDFFITSTTWEALLPKEIQNSTTLHHLHSSHPWPLPPSMPVCMTVSLPYLQVPHPQVEICRCWVHGNRVGCAAYHLLHHRNRQLTVM